MENKQVNSILLEHFPNLEKKYLEELEYNDYEELSSHNIYESILVPYLKNCIKMNTNAEIEKVFSFIENILKEDISYASEVIIFSVIEPLVSEYCRDEEIINKIISISGAKTKLVLDEFFERYIMYDNCEFKSNSEI